VSLLESNQCSPALCDPDGPTGDLGINAAGQWVEREQVNLNELFERMTQEELEATPETAICRIGSRGQSAQRQSPVLRTKPVEYIEGPDGANPQQIQDQNPRISP
jgi:hypothetical protein